MGFSAVFMVSSFEADDDTHDLVGVGEKNKTKTNKQQLYASLRHIDAVRSRTKAEPGKIAQHSWFIQTEMNRSCSQHSYFTTCPFGEGGVGVTSSMRHVRPSGGSVNPC